MSGVWCWLLTIVCLGSWPHSLSPSQKQDGLLTIKVSGEHPWRQMQKVFGGLGSEFHTKSLQAKQITRPVQIQGVEDTVYPRLLSNQLTNPPLLSIIPFYNQVFSFSLCPFHFDIYNLRIKGREVLKCEDIETQKGKEVLWVLFAFVFNQPSVEIWFS